MDTSGRQLEGPLIGAFLLARTMCEEARLAWLDDLSLLRL